jgi:hypothetical protein
MELLREAGSLFAAYYVAIRGEEAVMTQCHNAVLIF